MASTLDPINVVAGKNVYELSPPIGANIRNVTRIWYLGRELKVINNDDSAVGAETYNPDFATADIAVGDPTCALYDYVTRTISFDRLPLAAEAKGITVRCALSPSRTATTVPDFLLSDYEDAIANGAISRIARIPAQGYTDQSTAALSQSIYAAARHSATIRANKASARSESRVAMRPFA